MFPPSGDERPSTETENPTAAAHNRRRRRRDPTLQEGSYMYGHSHTGIGALVLTLVAGAKGGIGFLVRAIASPHW
jgi:hypothetical protein